MKLKEYREAIKEGLPIFTVFMCGAIAQLIMGTSGSIILKLLLWVGLYFLASFLHDRLKVK